LLARLSAKPHRPNSRRPTQELAAAGATFLGGCCGTNPDFIRALALQLSVLKSKKS
jgi:methionine synthase I (cobalamin-dependent)